MATPEELAAAAAAERKAIGDKFIKEACGRFGISPEFVHSARYDEATEEAVILTKGGTRVRYAKGDKVEKLDEIAITGINPKNAKKKVIAGAAK
ncbi:MAG: hypothetical protein LLG40_11225 [Deltaproteobacteria bacterium]|nr:hypothetical protein [Deltaproteobacteria bacterium]